MKIGIAGKFLSVGFLAVLAGGVFVGSKLVQQNQENRSQAASSSCKDSDICCTNSPNFGTCIRVVEQGLTNKSKEGTACKTTDGRDGELVYNKCLDPKWGAKVGNIRCCATKKNPNNNNYVGVYKATSNNCSKIGGFCADFGRVLTAGENCEIPEKISGVIYVGKCSGGSEIRCCAPKEVANGTVAPTVVAPTTIVSTPTSVQPQNTDIYPDSNNLCTNNNYPKNIKTTTWKVDSKDIVMYIFGSYRSGDKRIPTSSRYDVANIDNGSWLMEVPDNFKRPKTTDKYVLGDVCFESGNYGYSPYLIDKRIFPAYEAMRNALLADGAPDNAARLGCGYRDPKLQDLFYRRWNDSRWAASKCGSAHRTGRAMDLDVTGSFVSKSSGKKITVHQWIVNNAAKYGFRRYSLEDWHWEYNP